MNKGEIVLEIFEMLRETQLHSFIPGVDSVPVSGASIEPSDIVAVVDATLDGWFTEWKRAEKFARQLSAFTGVFHTTLCNSGSSANLLAMTAMKERYPNGGKVITCAVGFPTTVSSIIQAGFTPLFVDVDPQTLNVDTELVCDLICNEGVVGTFLAHTLGFPFDANEIGSASREMGTFFIEDCADALGAKVCGRPVGSFGDAGTTSFFPAHHITCGEGGAVFTSDHELHRIIESLSNWGRSCFCKPGQTEVCGDRFGKHFDSLPDEWDHKYTFERLGYNLKMTELQAALGLSQLQRIRSFVLARQDYYSEILGGLNGLSPYLNFVKIPEFAEISPFGFPITVSPNSYFSKNELVAYLEANKIRTRPVFGGNLLRHPAFQNIDCGVVGDLFWSNYVMENTFWVGCHPSLTEGHINYLIEKITNFVVTK